MFIDIKIKFHFLFSVRCTGLLVDHGRREIEGRDISGLHPGRTAGGEGWEIRHEIAERYP